MPETTHFGFETINAKEKTARVRSVFDTVASRYDLMNDAMSGGLHRLWKQAFVDSLRLRAGQHVCDLAGGTGDIAFLMHEKPAVDITVCDINEAMLREGCRRAIDRNLIPSAAAQAAQQSRLHWLCGNAETLPFASRSFEHCTIAFGIRNVTDIRGALSEIHRILKPGGRFACLEFSHISLPFLRTLYDRYSFEVIPRLGEWIAGDRAAYQYLVESIRQFPEQARFAGMLQDAGLAQVKWRNLSGGVVAIHSGWRI